MTASLRTLIEAKAARIHQLAAADASAGADRLGFETAELQAMIAEAAREERLAGPQPERTACFEEA